MIAPTEARDPRLTELDAWAPERILAALWQGQRGAADAVERALPAIAAAAHAALPRLAGDGRLVYAGAGTSGRIGAQDGAELEPTFGWPPARLVLLIAGGEVALLRAVEHAEDDTAAAHAAIAGHQVAARDVVIGIAASGATPFTVAALKAAKAAGALTIGVANDPVCPLLALADHAILLETGAEPIAGSTRLNAGTAQKIALNLLSTLLMVRLGRVYRGRMVDVKVTNAKLRARAIAMIAELGRTHDAAAALDAAGGSVKIALLMLRGLSRDQAVLRLSTQTLRQALEENKE